MLNPTPMEGLICKCEVGLALLMLYLQWLATSLSIYFHDFEFPMVVEFNFFWWFLMVFT
jgi:hypothetical protein